MVVDVDDVLLASVEKTQTLCILIELLDEIEVADEDDDEVFEIALLHLDDADALDNDMNEGTELDDEVELERIDGLQNVIIIDDTEKVVAYLEVPNGILDEVDEVEVQTLVIVTYQNVELDDADDADEVDIELQLVLEVRSLGLQLPLLIIDEDEVDDFEMEIELSDALDVNELLLLDTRQVVDLFLVDELAIVVTDIVYTALHPIELFVLVSHLQVMRQ